MGAFRKAVYFALTATVAGLLYRLLIEPHPVPQVEDEYWGPTLEQGKTEDSSIKPFEINISANIIDDLKERLKRELNSNRIVAPLESVGFNYGVNSKFIQTLGQYWLHKYDWKQSREKVLNKYPHFKTKIGGLEIHFQHVKPKSKNGRQSRPLLVIHGWPGSFVEFQKIIPLLSEPKNAKYNYELVIPSLPGYGFSSAATRPGMSPTIVASIFKRLMKRLGHEQFFVMGGDWGSMITSDISTLYPKNIIAAQSGLCTSETVFGQVRYLLATLLPTVFMTEEEKSSVRPVREILPYLLQETGYFHIQATRPDTVGFALNQSPIGLAAYILEKFSVWTNRLWISKEDGGLLQSFQMDELLDNVMIYWVTGSITSSMRIYTEYANPTKKYQLSRVPTNVPFSCQFMREDFFINPKFSLRDKFTNIQNYSVTSRGGHFGAFEEPELVAENAILHFEKF